MCVSACEHLMCVCVCVCVCVRVHVCACKLCVCVCERKRTCVCARAHAHVLTRPHAHVLTQFPGWMYACTCTSTMQCTRLQLSLKKKREARLIKTLLSIHTDLWMSVSNAVPSATYACVLQLYNEEIIDLLDTTRDPDVRVSICFSLSCAQGCT